MTDSKKLLANMIASTMYANAETMRQQPVVSPAEAVACLREALDLIAGVGRVPGDGYTEGRSAEDKQRGLYVARAALESLEAEVTRLQGQVAAQIQANDDEYRESSEVVTRQRDRISALESELAEKTARVAELPLRPALAWFAQAMERKLRANDHKGGWIDGKCDLLFLFEKLTEERRELTRATGKGGTPEQILEEAADVANIAMMIADVCQTFASPEGWDQPAAPVVLDRGGAVAADLAAGLCKLREVLKEDVTEPEDIQAKAELTAVVTAAERWAALQWREPSTAKKGDRVLFVGHRSLAMRGYVCIGERDAVRDVWLDEDTSNNGGMRIEWADDEVLGWLPLDALPALPSEPVKT
jgi:hypothetical protein